MNLDPFLNGTQAFAQGFLKLMFTGIAVLAGAWMVASAMRKLVADGSGQRQGRSLLGPVLINLFVATCMLQMAAFSSEISVLIVGSAPQPPANALSYMPSTVASSAFWKKLVTALAMWVSMIGSIGVFRGFLLWNQKAEGDANQSGDLGWRGLWHIIGGALALNIGGLGALFK